MWIDFSLLFLILNNISIFVVMVVGYSFLIDWLREEEPVTRQIALGLFFSAVVIISMHVKFPAAAGVVVDQRNALIVLSGAFGGPICALVTGALAALFRLYLGGIGAVAGAVGVALSVAVGIATHQLGWHRRGPMPLLAVAALSVAITAPVFLLVGDLQNGLELLKRTVAPWGIGIFLGIFLGGLLLRREDRRQETEREKQRSEQQFRTLFESSEVSIWNQDFFDIRARLEQLRDQGVRDLRDYIVRNPAFIDEMAALSRITLVNEATRRLYGVGSTQEFIDSQADLLGCARSGVFADQLLAVWHRRTAFRGEDTHRTRDGRELTVILSMPIPTRPEDFHSVPVSAFDITERKRAERSRNEALDQANRANQAKSDFLAAMSHELRTPLNAILGFSEILTTGTFGPLGSDRYVEYARHIHSSGGLLLELVNDLLDVSAIEAGRRELTITEVSVRELVDDAVSVISQRAADRGIAISIHLPDRPTAIRVDKRSIQQVLINLLSNSLKYTPTGGAVTVSVTGHGAGTDLTVKDTGHGIPPDRLEDVMNPFVRGEKDPHKAQGGWGLGLSIAKSLVEMHNGELIIESELGHGTAVTVRLPDRPPIDAPDAGDDILSAAG